MNTYYVNQGNRQGYRGPQRPYPPETPKKKISIDKSNYVDTADNVIKGLCNPKPKITTSQIRNILSMVSELYNDERQEHGKELSAEMQSRIQYLRLHIAYEAGREDHVREFVENAGLLDVIKDIGKDREKLMTFCHYMEALVAYHRYYGGKDQ